MVARIRINRFLASSGLGSRRKVEELIRRGSVYVNDEKIEDYSTTIDPDKDSVRVDQEEISLPTESDILVLNKPVGVLSTVIDDFDRRTVLEIARENGYEGRLYPIGRLDYNSSGIILLTNNGDLAFRLTHPQFKIDKKYAVKVNGRVSERTVNELASGVNIGDFITKACTVNIISSGDFSTTVEVVLREGRKRQIRRMFAAFGHKVVSLHRSAVGDLDFKDLVPGAIRRLTDIEERRLKEQVGL